MNPNVINGEADEYMRLKVVHAWRPGDPENIVPDATYGPNLSGNLIYANGELAR